LPFSIVKLLGAKDRAMGLIEHNNAEIQRYALQCVSKCLVQKWEWVR
jgi:V-type H+-transporting ATPase subunit H